MSKYKLTQVEQETIILYNQGEKDVEIYTHDPTLIKKLKEHPESARLKTSNEFGGYTFTVPKKELIIKLHRHCNGEELAKRQQMMNRARNLNK